MTESVGQQLSDDIQGNNIDVKGGVDDENWVVRPALLKQAVVLENNPPVKPLTPPCFWTAWNSHRDYLRRLSYVWMNVSAADAEDALSAATIRAFEKYDAHADQISNERAWFARLLHNICIDIHRSNKRRSKLSNKVKEIVTIDASEKENTEVTPEAELLNSELGKTITSAIRELPDKLQEPLIMRLVRGDEYDSIANSLSISNDNARKRVQQARAILRRKLSYLKD